MYKPLKIYVAASAVAVAVDVVGFSLFYSLVFFLYLFFVSIPTSEPPQHTEL